MSQLVREGNHLKPKYQKLADEIIAQIEEGKYAVNERIPSVNKLSDEFGLSRETVLKALNFLSEQGIIESAYRKGYYVKKTNVKVGLRIFLLMDKMTVFKNRMYTSFMETIGDKGEVHLYFYHHDYDIFKSMIEDNLNNYTHFVVVTYLHQQADDVLNLIPPEKRLILDHHEPNLNGSYAMVYQDFEDDIYNCLVEAYGRLKKYSKLVLVCAESRYEGKKVIKGFKRFCAKNKFGFEIVGEVNESTLYKDAAYLLMSPSTKELVDLIKLSRKHNYKFGKDLGVLSYNDTYVNEVLEGGISVFSTDFEKLGWHAASLILNKQIEVIRNPSKLILRASL